MVKTIRGTGIERRSGKRQYVRGSARDMWCNRRAYRGYAGDGSMCFLTAVKTMSGKCVDEGTCLGSTRTG